MIDVTEEIAFSTLNLSLFLVTFARSESYIKNGIEVHIKRGKALKVYMTDFFYLLD